MEKTLTEKTFAMTVDERREGKGSGVMLPTGTRLRAIKHIGFHPLDGVPVYSVEATLDGESWKAFTIDGHPRVKPAE